MRLWWVIRSWVGALAIGVLLLLAGLSLHQVLAARAETRVAAGEPTDAVVVETRRPRSSAPWMTVEYEYDNEIQQRRLFNGLFLRSTWRSIGDTITVYVDPTDPGTVTTASGFTSGHAWLQAVPGTLVGFGGIIAIVAAAQPIRHRSEARWAAQPRIYDLSVEWDGDTSFRDRPERELGRSAWEKGFAQLSEQVAGQRRRQRRSPVALQVVFVPPTAPGESGDFSEPIGDRVRVESFARRQRVLRVSVQLPARPGGEAYNDLLAYLQRAVAEGNRHLADQRTATDLTALRSLVDSLRPEEHRP